jgi:hypothetical protein
LDCKYQPFIICCNCTMTKTEILFKQKKKRLMQGFFVTFISIDSQSFRN